tara:strand:+ start:278 stop:829 length:552 start_codon:yes stop_codon:yes gene_type:complete
MKTAFKILFFSCLTILCLFIIEKNKEIRQYKLQEQQQLEFLDTLQLELDDLKEEIKELLEQMDSMPDVIFEEIKATMYHPVEEQCDDTPLITADGSKIDPHKVSNWNWIAVSQHMLTRNGGPLNYGDTVYIFGTKHKDGVYVIKDCMNKRKTNQIDFLESLGTPQYRYDNVVIARFPQENLDS